ncbi:MAG: H-NS histone family protein [Rhodobacteraceae bacterium]|nr:H-NS histone family protein [Paracoccaceae bacterium]
MSKIDLTGLSKGELQKLRKEVDKAIVNYDARAKQDALAVLESKAKELGFSLSELTGSVKKTKSINPPKYRNPSDPALTWTGRGRQPQWIKDALAAGENLDAYAI